MISFMWKVLCFLNSEEFRSHPWRSVYRRLYWRFHWRLYANRPFVVQFYNDMKIRLANSSASFGIYLNNGFSNPKVASLFIEAIKPGMVVVDAGAHIGEYTLLFASMVGGKGEVHAFEPDPRIIPYLKENINRNNLSNVYLNHVALGDKVGEIPLILSEDPTASSIVPNGCGDNTQKVIIPITTLDAYVKNLKRVDILKLNVEGAAFSVLEGALWILKNIPPLLIWCECDKASDVSRIRTLLEQYGYNVEVKEWGVFPHIIARHGK